MKRLSGKEVVGVFTRLGFQIQSQKGSHIKLYRLTNLGIKEILTVPLHAELDTGTLRAIIRQAARYIPASDLKTYFYS